MKFIRPQIRVARRARLGPPILLIASIAAALFLTTFASSALAQQPKKPEITSLKLGFDGKYKVGYWTPVDISILGGSTSETGFVELLTSDADTIVRIPSQQYQLLPGQTTRVRMTVKFGVLDADLTVRFRTKDGILFSKTYSQTGPDDSVIPIPLMSSSRLYVAVGPDGGLVDAVQIQNASNRLVEVATVTVDDLPGQWQGYEGVDAMVITTSQPDIFSTLRADSAQVVALDLWLRMGGKLILSAGANAPTLLDRGPLATFAPGEYTTMAPVRRVTALETFSEHSSQIEAGAAGRTTDLQTPRFDGLQGIVEVREGDAPLVVRSPRGFGEIVFSAVDLDQGPLSKWAGRAALVNKMLGYVGPAPGTEDTYAYSYYGYNDLTGQLRQSLDYFSGVKLVPFSLVFLLVVVYILLIGPGDYFLVKKVLKRMEATWITFPLIVLIFSGVAYYLANWMKGDEIRLNQVDIIDVDASSGFVRGTTYANVFSPATQTYDFSLHSITPEIDEPRVILSWMGLPGSALGGMESGASTRLFARSFSLTPALDQMLGVPIAIWSSKALQARWHADSSIDPLFESELTLDDQRMLSGVITNRLDNDLHGCLLLYETSAYRLGDIPSGGAVQVLPNQRFDLQFVLKDVKITGAGSDYRREATPYDYSGNDIDSILRSMMFHEAIGDTGYTRLDLAYQSFIDLSGAVRGGSPVLMGVAETPPVRLHSSGQPIKGSTEYWTIYRCMLPLEGADNPAEDGR